MFQKHYIEIKIGSREEYNAGKDFTATIHLTPCNARLEAVMALSNKIVEFAKIEALKTEAKEIERRPALFMPPGTLKEVKNGRKKK